MTETLPEELFPPIEPYYFDYLAVGNGHEIYYEVCGNPHGIPVLYLHGGPGLGCDENARRFFNPEKCRIILFDQRGSRRSKPYASINANTTWHLVGDIHKLLGHCGKEKIVLFGGSWGSTLALVYATCYPKSILGMVLRGIFLSERNECLDYLNGQTAHSRFPEICERFLDNIPVDARKNPAEYYFTMMTCGDPEARRKYAYEWSFYEWARLRLVPPPEEVLEKEILSESFVSLAMMEAHYIRNQCFLEDDFILENSYRIPHVPISIIHGRYDDLCPVESAIRLHRALPTSKLHIVTAGHGRSEPEILKKLVSETDRMITEIAML
ncbi:MAG: proline iminopeptidase [Parcubacteria group bacterium Gr01-1014_70]|nr:MAG: proline iminopeptidase [Parcubacteria group bacterium Gr01-1014_70]